MPLDWRSYAMIGMRSIRDTVTIVVALRHVGQVRHQRITPEGIHPSPHTERSLGHAGCWKPRGPIKSSWPTLMLGFAGQWFDFSKPFVEKRHAIGFIENERCKIVGIVVRVG